MLSTHLPMHCTTIVSRIYQLQRPFLSLFPGIINALAGTAYMLAASGSLLPGADFSRQESSARTQSEASTPTGGTTAPPRGSFRLWLTLGVLTATMTVAASAPSLLVPTALSALCVLLRCGCMDLSDAWKAVNGPVLLSIALSFALGKGIEESGLAASAANAIVKLVAPYGELGDLEEGKLWTKACSAHNLSFICPGLQ